jgi:2-polyprenyl-3-methyl-5-hydroxy-6-metoxy-1,4-benzoquinol methylase
MKISGRSYEQELLDGGPFSYTEDEYHHCLLQLDKIGRLLGGDAATFKTLRQMNLELASILDVGCGGGLFTVKLAQAFPQAQVLGIDTNSQAIAFAKKNLEKEPSLTNVQFEAPATPRLSYEPKQFDLVTCTLVCHHLNDEELIDFLKQSYLIAGKAVIINDLHRNFFGWAGFKLLAPLLFRNRLVLHDGPLSVKRAFTKQDWIAYLKAAQIPPERFSIKWHWAFRWIVSIDTSQ